MSYYPENKIREACRKVVMLTPAIEEQLMTALKKEDDLADTDTITVKELREAWHRDRNPAAWTSQRLDTFLRDISKHREPEYPYASVWRDNDGIVWMRAMDDRDRVNMWLRMGREGKYSDGYPKRPLRRMDIIS